jgi:putative membrane protein
MDGHHRTVHLLAGLAGGLVASFAMERFQRALGVVSPDLGGAPGGGGQQYRKPESEPATYVAADAIAQAATGRPLPPSLKPTGGSVVHYAFGGSVGLLYGALAGARPAVAAGYGMPFGIAVWMVADEIGMPASGLAKPPTAYSLKDHASALSAHLVYGAVTEAVRRSIIDRFACSV